MARYKPKRKYRKNNYSRTTNYHRHARDQHQGDVWRELSKGLSYAYEKGGPGLVLVIVGFMFGTGDILFKSALDPAAFYVVLVLAVAAVIWGIKILLNRENNSFTRA